MTSDIRAEIQRFVDDRNADRPTNAYALVDRLIDAQSPEITTFIEMAIEQLPDAGTFFNDAISFVPEQELCRLASLAIGMFRLDGSETAEDFIAHCSLQNVEALHPHLADLLVLMPNWSTYNANWPWRGSGKLQFPRLANLAMSSTDAEEALSAWRKLLETRNPEVLGYCASNITALETAINRAGAGTLVAHEFEHVGYELRGNQFRQLYPERVLHLVFADAYWPDETAPHLVKRHPTWRRNNEPSLAYSFGGRGTHTCPACGELAHHIISFDPVPDNLGVTELATLVLETCLNCVQWGEAPLFYRHTPDGVIHVLEYAGAATTLEFKYDALDATEVHLAETLPRWQWQDWGHANGRQNLSRLGGHPSWIQSADYRPCPSCGVAMCALMQLDSPLVTADGEHRGELLWGSGGICYVQWCDDCKVSGYVIQCT
jgi:hypothetical protein